MAVGEIASYRHSPLEVVRVPMFSNNYGWIVRDKATGTTAAVDPAEPSAIQAVLDARNWKLDLILNTHHHQDHVGGNQALKEQHKCTIIGPKAEQGSIPLIDKAVESNDAFQLGNVSVHVFDTPGHTCGHITFWAPESDALFPGDTLFAMGCGRLFEGTPEQMWASLSKFKDLPEHTQVFCAHEYTQSNARWAVTVDPNNTELQMRAAQVDKMRAAGEATVPTTLGQEFQTNPFMRPDSPGIRRTLGIDKGASDAEAFGIIRRHKDFF